MRPKRPSPDAPRLTLLHPFINKSGQSDPLPQPGGKSSGSRLLGACLGPAWGLLAALLANTPGREAPSGGRAPFGGKSPGWGLLGALGPAQGPVELPTPGRGRKCGQKPLGLGSLPLYAACIRYGYLWHCRGKAGSGPASPGPMRDALLGRSLSARTASGSPGWVTSPQLDFRVVELHVPF